MTAILAHILARTVDEFFGMHPEDVVAYIEGEPLIGTVPIDPGMTNESLGQKGERIVGLNTENAEVNEGRNGILSNQILTICSASIPSGSASICQDIA